MSESQVSIDLETGIWNLDIAKKRHRCDLLLAARIGMLYHPEKAADLGCGNGRYCAIFKSYGWPVIHGYEGTPDINSLGIYDDIMHLDLTKRRWVGIKYDFVLCLEVGEHIPAQHEQVFLDNVAEFTSKDLIFSWAIPGQGGKGHFNEQPNDYIISELLSRNLIYDEVGSLKLRKFTSLRWFKNTLMIFNRKENTMNEEKQENNKTEVGEVKSDKVEITESKDQYPKEINFKPLAKILEMTWRKDRAPASKTWNGIFTTEVTKFNRISLCTTVMNRLKDVKQTIPKNMEDNADYKNAEFLILDYNSTDGLEDWVRKKLLEYIKTGRVAFFRTTGPTFFDMSHSRNLAFKLATGDIVNNVDADAYTNEGFITFINKLANEQPKKAMFAKSKQLLRGRLGFYRKEFIELLGGYDEDLTGYGHDDADLMNRGWELGFTMMPFRGPFSGCTADHVKHQSGNYRELWWKTEGRNRFLSYVKILLSKWRANEGRKWGIAKVKKMDPETGEMINWDVPEM